MQSVDIFVDHFRMVVILEAKTNTKIGQNNRLSYLFIKL